MWKRDQSKGILEGRGRKKMQTMQKEWGRPEARIRRVRDNGGTKEFRYSVKWDGRRAGRTKSGNGEEEGKRQDGHTARRPKNKVARVLATSGEVAVSSGSFKKYVI